MKKVYTSKYHQHNYKMSFVDGSKGRLHISFMYIIIQEITKGPAPTPVELPTVHVYIYYQMKLHLIELFASYLLNMILSTSVSIHLVQNHGTFYMELNIDTIVVCELCRGFALQCFHYCGTNYRFDSIHFYK